MSRLRYAGRNRIDKRCAGDLPHVDLADVSGGGIGHWATRSGQDRETDALLAGLGDVVVSKLRPYLRKVFLPDRLVTCSSEFLVIVPGCSWNSRYLGYCVGSQDFTAFATASVEGAKMPRTSWESVREYRLPAMELERQAAIADFLDCECDRIRAVTVARVAQMNAIAALQQAWLDEAMAAAPTAGPTRLRDLLRASPCYGVLVPRFSDDLGVPFIRVSDLGVSGLEGRVLPTIVESQSAEYSRTVVSAGDVLVSVVGSVDRSAIVPESLEGANVARAVARLQPAPGVPSFFLWACTRTSQYKEQALLFTSADTAQPTLNMGDLSRFRLSAPQTAEERASIELKLRAGFEVSDDLATETLRAEAALAEYRDALITEAVTGQLDVTRTCEHEMEEGLAAVGEGERPEILAS